MSSVLWSGVALALYVGISLGIGEWFPFSRYAMYARLRGRVEGAVLYVKTGDRLVNIAEFDQFVGIDSDQIHPRGYPCSQEWVVWETQRWVRDHPHQDAGADFVPVEIGFRILSVANFQLQEHRVPLATGMARWRHR